MRMDWTASNLATGKAMVEEREKALELAEARLELERLSLLITHTVCADRQYDLADFEYRVDTARASRDEARTRADELRGASETARLTWQNASARVDR